MMEKVKKYRRSSILNVSWLLLFVFLKIFVAVAMNAGECLLTFLMSSMKYLRWLSRGGVEFPLRCISSSRANRNKIPAVTPVLLQSNFSMALTPTLLDISLNRKSKMAAVKRKFPYLGLY
jgi:hypothetical protein